MSFHNTTEHLLMPSAWKLKRELKRLGLQFRAIPEFFYEPVVQWQYDRNRERDLIAQDGNVRLAGKVALLLVYQPAGVAESVFKTCDHLVSKGYAPLVISNSPLSNNEQRKFLSRCWMLAERPNFGYDFGGYRDGIWLLNKMQIIPDHLIVMNDSVWFPITKETNLIPEMEACPADYVGTQTFARAAQSESKRKWAQPFFGSYLFMIKKKAFENPDFQSFWTDYKLTSNKGKTLYRGERAFSYRMFSAKIQSEGLYSCDRFDAVVAALDETELSIAIKYLVCMDSKLENQRQQLLNQKPADTDWPTACRNLIHASSETKNYIGSSPVLCIRKLDVPMIKKNNEMLYRKARMAILQAISDGILDGLDNSVLSEIHDRAKAQNA